MLIKKEHVPDHHLMVQGSIVILSNSVAQFVVTRLGLATMDELKPHPNSVTDPVYKNRTN